MAETKEITKLTTGTMQAIQKFAFFVIRLFFKQKNSNPPAKRG
jgi:hypothetical protein